MPENVRSQSDRLVAQGHVRALPLFSYHSRAEEVSDSRVNSREALEIQTLLARRVTGAERSLTTRSQ